MVLILTFNTTKGEKNSNHQITTNTNETRDHALVSNCSLFLLGFYFAALLFRLLRKISSPIWFYYFVSSVASALSLTLHWIPEISKRSTCLAANIAVTVVAVV